MRHVLWMLSFAAAVMMLSSASGQATQPTTRPKPVVGTLIRVDNGSLIVQPKWKPADAAPVVFNTDSRTKFFIDMDRVRPEDLKPGMELQADLRPTSGDPNPSGYVHVSSPGLSGSVVRIDGTRVILKTSANDGGGEEITVETSDATKVHMMEHHAYFPDLNLIAVKELKPGSKVVVVPMQGVARHIFVKWPVLPEEPVTQPSK